MSSDDESTFRVAAFQGPIKQCDPEASLEKTCEALEWAQQRDAHVLCMPETYLQGYFQDRDDAWANSIDLQSSEFADICSRVSSYNTTLLLGLNERRGEDLYNTVVVIERGELVGRYSKNFLVRDYFRQGLEFPVFERAGVRYGIIICKDSSFVESARILAMRGADVIFSPHFNRIVYDDVDRHTRKVRNMHVARAVENGVWMVRSNIIDPGDGERIGVGDSFIMNDLGEVVSRAGILTETILFHAIETEGLGKRKRFGRHISPEMREALIAQYRAPEEGEIQV